MTYRQKLFVVAMIMLGLLTYLGFWGVYQNTWWGSATAFACILWGLIGGFGLASMADNNQR